MNIKELDRRVREIVALTRVHEQSDWDIADRLWAFDEVDYETALPRIISETGWTRNSLSMHRQTARYWPKAERMDDVPYAKHQEFRYRKEELRRQYRTRTLGQTIAKRRQRFTLGAMTRAITAILDLCDDKTLTDHARVLRIRQIVEVFRGATRKRAA